MPETPLSALARVLRIPRTEPRQCEPSPSSPEVLKHSSCHTSIYGGYTLLFVGMPSKKLTSSKHMLQTLFSSLLVRKYNRVKAYPQFLSRKQNPIQMVQKALNKELPRKMRPQWRNEEWMGLPWWSSGLKSACQSRGHGFDPWFRKTAHATGHLSACVTATELTCSNYWSLHA